MKKLFAFALATALMTPVMAQEEDVAGEVDTKVVYENEENKDSVREAVWPAFFAVAEWPETPDLIGLRLTIPFSTKQESVTGFDLGLWGFCYDFEGLQMNLIRNNVRDTFGGVQFGCYNSVNRGDLFGIQFGLWNEAYSFRGVQCGLINVTGDAQGFQIGLINRAETMYGVQIGLINVIRDAEIPVFPLVNIGF